MGAWGQTEHETKWKAKSRVRKPVSFMGRKNEGSREEVEEVNGEPRSEVRGQVSTGLLRPPVEEGPLGHGNNHCVFYGLTLYYMSSTVPQGCPWTSECHEITEAYVLTLCNDPPDHPQMCGAIGTSIRFIWRIENLQIEHITEKCKLIIIYVFIRLKKTLIVNVKIWVNRSGQLYRSLAEIKWS